MVPATRPILSQGQSSGEQLVFIGMPRETYEKLVKQALPSDSSSSGERRYGLPRTIPFHDRMVVEYRGPGDYRTEASIDPDFNIDAIEDLTKKTFYHLIIVRFDQGLPYIVASVKYSEGATAYRVFRYDALAWEEKKSTMPQPLAVNYSFIEKNNISAFSLCHSLVASANFGDPISCYSLSLAYWYGGVPSWWCANAKLEEKSEEKALIYAELAAQKGLKIAQKFLVNKKPSLVDKVFPKPISGSTEFFQETDLTDGLVKDVPRISEIIYLLELEEQIREKHPSAKFGFDVDYKLTREDEYGRESKFDFRIDAIFVLNIEIEGKLFTIRRKARSEKGNDLYTYNKGLEQCLNFDLSGRYEYFKIIFNANHPNHSQLRPSTDLFTIEKTNWSFTALLNEDKKVVKLRNYPSESEVRKVKYKRIIGGPNMQVYDIPWSFPSSGEKCLIS